VVASRELAQRPFHGPPDDFAAGKDDGREQTPSVRADRNEARPCGQHRKDHDEVERPGEPAKGISSPVAGDADILLVPDLVSGNILAKNLEYLGSAVAAGIALGMAVPVVLTSRADPAPSRLASLALAALMHHRMLRMPTKPPILKSSFHCIPQPDHVCRPMPG
jgi:Phosphate acetyl/butaryl transferase